GRPGAASGHTVARGGGTDSRRPAALFGQAPQRDDEPPCRSRRPAIPWHRGAAGPDYRSRGSSVMGRAARKNLSADCRRAPAIGSLGPHLRFLCSSGALPSGIAPPYPFQLPLPDRSMPAYRSRTTTPGRNVAGARGLWRATGMKEEDFGKPIIAVVNSFTQFVPGHVHLKDLGQLVAREIEAAGGVAKEFNTIAVDDGIAMGHDGMLYSLPSRDLIADSVEYMVNAHCADAMVCISNCDKI